jgi:hypothetical protein
VVLHVPDEAALKRIADTLSQQGVAFVKIEEDDEPYRGALMALGLVPARKESVRRHLSQLPLLR